MKYRRIILTFVFFAEYNFLVMCDIWGRILWHLFGLATETNLRDKFKKVFPQLIVQSHNNTKTVAVESS